MRQPCLGTCDIHKKLDPLILHQLTLGAKQRGVVINNRHALYVSLQRSVAREALAPGFMRLKILEILFTQIEYEIERAVLTGQLLDKPQRFSCALLGLRLSAAQLL